MCNGVKPHKSAAAAGVAQHCRPSEGEAEVAHSRWAGLCLTAATALARCPLLTGATASSSPHSVPFSGTDTFLSWTHKLKQERLSVWTISLSCFVAVPQKHAILWHGVGMGDKHPSCDRPQGTRGWLQWQEAAVMPGPRGTPASVVRQGEGLIADVDEGFILFHFKNTSKLHTKS